MRLLLCPKQSLLAPWRSLFHSSSQGYSRVVASRRSKYGVGQLRMDLIREGAGGGVGTENDKTAFSHAGYWSFKRTGVRTNSQRLSTGVITVRYVFRDMSKGAGANGNGSQSMDLLCRDSDCVCSFAEE